MSRVGECARLTRETRIQASINLDGSGSADVKTGLGFLDHMLENLARHSGFDIELQCLGDLNVDDHHTAEDCAIALGSALDEALVGRRGIRKCVQQFLARIVVAGWTGRDLTRTLSEEYGVYTFGNFPGPLDGVYVSPNVFNSPADLDRFCDAIKRIAAA